MLYETIYKPLLGIAKTEDPLYVIPLDDSTAHPLIVVLVSLVMASGFGREAII
jgi:hypothetical protein